MSKLIFTTAVPAGTYPLQDGQVTLDADAAAGSYTLADFVPPVPLAPSFTATVAAGYVVTVQDKSTGTLPTDEVLIAWSDGKPVECPLGGSVTHTYPNASQRMITQTVTRADGTQATSKHPVYPGNVTPPAGVPPPPVIAPPVVIPPPVTTPPPATAFALQVMPANAALPDAVITGTAAGVPVALTVKSGQRVPLVTNPDGTYAFQYGAVTYYPDGGLVLENSYVGDGNPTPADLAVSLHIACGDKAWDTGDLTIEYKCWTRTFWVVEPTIKDFDRSKFPNYGMKSAGASYVAAYAKADNSLMGPGLIIAQMGNEGEHDWLGLLNAWDAAYLVNPSADAAAVVLGMSDAGNVFPFHAIDTATNVMLDAYAYAKTSDNANYRGLAGNPFRQYTTALPVGRSLEQCTGHAPSFHVLAAAMFQSDAAKAGLSQWTAYLTCWQANYTYRLPNGPAKFTAEEGARGAAWTTRQLAQAAQFSDQPALFEGWLKLRLAEMTSAMGAAGPFPIMTGWLVYPTNNGTTGWAFAPWQVLDMLGQSLGYCLQLGYTDAQPVFDMLALIRMDSIDQIQHEFATIYSLAACENGDRPNGARATSWVEALTWQAALNPNLAAALACLEGSVELQSAYAGLPAGQLPAGYQAGDFLGYPASPNGTGYSAIARPMFVMIKDHYTDDPVRAAAVYAKFDSFDREEYSKNPKYDQVPRAA